VIKYECGQTEGHPTASLTKQRAKYRAVQVYLSSRTDLLKATFCSFYLSKKEVVGLN
jgi:hypothetical protein